MEEFLMILEFVIGCFFLILFTLFLYSNIASILTKESSSDEPRLDALNEEHTLDVHNEEPCCVCGSMLDAWKFKEKDGKIYCLSHYKKITKQEDKKTKNSSVEKTSPPKKKKKIIAYCSCGKEIGNGITGQCKKCLHDEEELRKKAFSNERKARRKRKKKTQEELAHEETKAQEILNNFTKSD